jgi:hypothetical protein
LITVTPEMDLINFPLGIFRAAKGTPLEVDFHTFELNFASLHYFINIYIMVKKILHNEELHNLYSTPNTIGMVKLRRIRWAGH